MTTIACGNRIMVSDSLYTLGDTNWKQKTRKVRKIYGHLVGCAGETDKIELFFRWFKQSFDSVQIGPPEFPKLGENFVALVMRPDGSIYRQWDNEVQNDEEGSFAAIGSGWQFALGAMEAGADPITAVSIAIDYDIYSGGELQIVRLEDE